MTERTYIYGKHAVLEAVHSAPHAVAQVFLAEKPDDAFAAQLARAGVKAAALKLGDLPKGFDREARHQGYIAAIEPEKLVMPYDEFAGKLAPEPDTALVVLGEVQDPQNVGAIIRSAAAFGVAGVLIPTHNQSPITGAVVKVSAGMAFRVPLVAIGNVNTTLLDLKERGFWIYGLDMEAKETPSTETFDRPSVFVFGNEGAGIREKTREHCDILLSIPMHPRAESLNVSVSAAVTLYAWSANHPDALKHA